MGNLGGKALERLRAFNRSVASRDRELGEEGRSVKAPKSYLEGVGYGPGDEESIIMRTQRPVLAVKKDAASLVFGDKGDAKVWKARLKKAAKLLTPAIRAVGRVELRGHQMDWVGTGWLLKDDVVVTNRHVASVFAAKRGDSFPFKQATTSTGTMSASVDFLREVDRDDRLAFKVKRVLYIAPENGPDLAFLEVEPRSGKNALAKKIELSSAKAGAVPGVAVIGYPARDSRIPDFDLMEEIFGDVFDNKRLAPGEITKVDDVRVIHDCSTLGGNSGSVILDLESGEALGLHFGGRFLDANFGVRADVVRKHLEDLRGRPRGRGLETGESSTTTPRGVVANVVGDGNLSFPLSITVSLGNGATLTQSLGGEIPQIAIPDFGEEDGRWIEDPDDDTEAKKGAKGSDLSKRGGYEADFIGKGAKAVPLPELVKHKSDILRFGDDEKSFVLDYEHFSVVMSKSRRMCRFSAANINGKLSGKTGRGKWKLDPRIPVEYQIIKECYGNAPKFSRGHMTRREDPAWGTSAVSQRGSDDSMHVTNATPQMQAFNSPIWLALEDYALQNARNDGMKISVFTGPYLEERDPVLFDVKVPVRFWKVIAFIHDETGKLCATGYEMSQEKSLPKTRRDRDTDEELVFGQFVSPHTNLATQVPIASIERKAGITFGKLSKIDGFGAEEAAGVEPPPLLSFEQIRFF